MNIFDIPTHPAADVFPMLPDDELEELAFDIKANGLQQPLVIGELQGKPVLVDGRNRREACRRVSVIPKYVLLDGHDPVTYIVSANIHRRNLSKGQRAMVVARVCSETKQTLRQVSEQNEIALAAIGRASTVLRHAPDLANHVLDGSLSLDKAYEEARIRKGQADTYESRFNALKAAAPDLADLVTDGQLNLEEAQAALDQRESQIRRENIGVAHGLHALAQHSYLLEHEVRREQVAKFVLSEADLYQKQNPDSIDEVFHALEVFEKHAGTLLARIEELKAEKENVEKGG